MRVSLLFAFRSSAAVLSRIDDFSKILSQAHSNNNNNNNNSSQGGNTLFDGNFNGNPFINPTAIHDMSALRSHITPEMQSSMQAMMQSLQDGSGVPGGFGVMAFGVGENEKGKKVARTAKMAYDANTGKIEKDFQETQLEPDDVSLPKETVEDYSTESVMEVTFVEDQDSVEAPQPVLPTAEDNTSSSGKL